MTFAAPSRRALLQGAMMLTAVPVAASAGGVPLFDVVGAPEPVEPETPVMRLFRQWEAALEEHDAAYDAAQVQSQGQGFEWEDVIYETFAPKRRAIEKAMTAEPATNLQDLAAKVIVLSGDGTWALPNEVALECAGLAGRDFDKLPRFLFNEEAEAA